MKQITQDEFDQFLDAHPDLTSWGHNPQGDRDYLRRSLRQVHAAQAWLETHTPDRGRNTRRRTSNWLKHRTEHWSDVHVTNGAVIAAVAILGLRHGADGMNVIVDLATVPRPRLEDIRHVIRNALRVCLTVAADDGVPMDPATVDRAVRAALHCYLLEWNLADR